LITFQKLGEFGRLGNQLFQIASTIGIATKNNAGYVFPTWKYSHFFEKEIPQSDDIVFQDSYHEKTFTYQSIHLDSHVDWNLSGFFQSEKYFLHCRELIRSFLTLKTEHENYIQEKYGQYLKYPTCAIHVRRGDYLVVPENHPVQPLDYYRQAMEIVGNDNLFIVCSDDVAWCKENFKGPNFVFIEGEMDIIDMFVMSKCTNQIIANSSFSWWGAWLNAHQSKKLIAPSQWFGPGINDSWRDIYLKEMIVI